MAQLYRDACTRYCWPVASLDDVKLAPFHVLASEGAVHANKDHLWHLDMAARLRRADPEFFRETGHRVVNLGAGGEGMVVKPGHFIATG